MLAKSHGLPRAKDRKAVEKVTVLKDSGTVVTQNNPVLYNKADLMIDKIYEDLATGTSKTRCIKKIQSGEFGYPVKDKGKATEYYNAAMDRFCEDRDIKTEQLRDLLYTRYEKALEIAMEKKDVYNARGILDSMARVFGAETKSPAQAILINGGGDKVEVNFGFDTDK